MAARTPLRYLKERYGVKSEQWRRVSLGKVHSAMHAGTTKSHQRKSHGDSGRKFSIRKPVNQKWSHLTSDAANRDRACDPLSECLPSPLGLRGIVPDLVSR
jgi:hypothetical protein